MVEFWSEFQFNLKRDLQHLQPKVLLVEGFTSFLLAEKTNQT